MRPAEIVRTCREKGVDRLAVTDHNTVRGALELQALAPELIIVGEEIMTAKGELLAYFVQAEVPPFLSPTETITRLRAQGCVISVSHPFDRLRDGAWEPADLAAIIHLVDALEVFNSRVIFPEDNARALAFAREHAKLGTVGSDAHSYRELGRSTITMPSAASPADLLNGLTQGEAHTHLSSPLIHLTSTYAKTYKKIRPQR